jgi:hypothetical protein
MENNQYHIPKEATQAVEDRIRQASKRELEKWANDPTCIEMESCGKELERRQNPVERQPDHTVEGSAEKRLPWSRKGADDSFNPRTDISADAKHIASRIVTHLWIIFVLMPFVIGLLLWLFGVIK